VGEASRRNLRDVISLSFSFALSLSLVRLLTPTEAKATDENLTSEDWGAIIEVCDKVSGDPNGSKEAVQSMIKRLAHRNANVQLYTLEVCPSHWFVS
jgi:hypothetical protein